MKQKTTYIIILFLIILSTNEVIGQKIKLNITSELKNEQTVLNNIEFSQFNIDSISSVKEINRISNYLKTLGYLSNSYKTAWKNKNETTAHFTLNRKIEEVILKTNLSSENNFKSLKIKNNKISIPFSELKNTLIYISKELENQGKSFSKVQLKNIIIKSKTLFAELKINKSKDRTIDKIIVKGYENFPKSFLKNHFNLKLNTIFKQKKIEELSKATKNIDFISEIKPPEILFTKDSTIIYMYLKRKQRNSFDGNVNFASKENGNLLFNGNINLNLNNTLNKGEKFELYYNNIGEEKQEFSLSAETPYIFNSKISPEFTFLIHKEDSTFISTKFESRTSYKLNQKTNIAFTYNSESSKNLNNEINNNTETYNNYFIGLKFQYRLKKNDFFLNDKFNIEINPSIGKRNTNLENLSQIKIESKLSYLLDINSKNSFYINNETGVLISDNLLNNELFRIGGANTIRGFNEQSLFTEKYSFLNIEYRYLTSSKSYFYTITDIAKLNVNSESKNLIGLGLGYLFTSNNSQINISSVTSKNNNQNIDLKNTKLLISWVNFF